MKSLNNIYIEFVEKFKMVLLFISENFGDKGILIRKNQGLIQSKNLAISNSPVKGYIFHGSGCDFRLKNDSLDIEFENDSIGFTDWSFYCFAKKFKSGITEMEIKEFLNDKVKENRLKFNNKIYEIND